MLDELAGLLHRIQLLQLIPAAAAADDAELLALSGRIGPEDVQLWYQMAVTGRRDLPLAPTPRVGFEMALLRMLAFAPVVCEGQGAPSRNSRQTIAPSGVPTGRSSSAPSATATGRSSSAPSATATGRSSSVLSGAAIASVRAQPEAVPAVGGSGGSRDAADSFVAMTATDSPDTTAKKAPDDAWSALIDRAQLRGPVGQLARHATLIAIEEKLVRLSLKPPHDHLAEGPLLAQLEQRLGSALGRSIKLKFERDSGGAASPAELRARAESARHAAAENAVHADPLVQSLIDTFGAHVIPESIRPTDS